MKALQVKVIEEKLLSELTRAVENPYHFVEYISQLLKQLILIQNLLDCCEEDDEEETKGPGPFLSIRPARATDASGALLPHFDHPIEGIPGFDYIPDNWDRSFGVREMPTTGDESP